MWVVADRSVLDSYLHQALGMLPQFPRLVCVGTPGLHTTRWYIHKDADPLNAFNVFIASIPPSVRPFVLFTTAFGFAPALTHSLVPPPFIFPVVARAFHCAFIHVAFE